MKTILDGIACALGYTIMAASGLTLSLVASYWFAERIFKILRLYEHLYRFIVLRKKFEIWFQATYPDAI